MTTMGMTITAIPMTTTGMTITAIRMITAMIMRMTGSIRMPG